jgi:putative salt-induced outer membrane protein
MIRPHIAAFTLLTGLTFATTGLAQETLDSTTDSALDPAILKLMEHAAARGDGSLEMIMNLAIDANPDQSEAIRAAASALRPAESGEPVEAPAVAVAPVQAPAEPVESAATVEEKKPTTLWSLRGWDGEIEFSANRSTGNTSQMGLGLGAAVTKEVERWKHEARTLIEFEENDSETTKQRFLVGYDINYTFNHRAYVFTNLLYEDDRFGGYDYRFSETVGLGYKIIDREALGFSIEAGPGARHTNEEIGGIQTEFVGLLGSKFFWHINDRSTLTHNYAMFIGSDRTTVDTTAALKLQINGALSARLSYNYRYDSNVPLDTKKTDTVTKAAIVYDF